MNEKYIIPQISFPLVRVSQNAVIQRGFKYRKTNTGNEWVRKTSQRNNPELIATFDKKIRT